MRLFSWLRKFWAYPSHQTLIANELEEAKRELLNAESAKEYATAIVEYNTKRVARLTAKSASTYTA